MLATFYVISSNLPSKEWDIDNLNAVIFFPHLKEIPRINIYIYMTNNRFFVLGTWLKKGMELIN